MARESKTLLLSNPNFLATSYSKNSCLFYFEPNVRAELIAVDWLQTEFTHNCRIYKLSTELGIIWIWKNLSAIKGYLNWLIQNIHAFVLNPLKFSQSLGPSYLIKPSCRNKIQFREWFSVSIEEILFLKFLQGKSSWTKRLAETEFQKFFCSCFLPLLFLF